jgi:putative Ca2+/H+ antiporter (TMEM165/GDT1 family)
MRGSFFMAPDRTHMQRRRKMLLFMKVLFTQFIAEMGDKTQLMLVAMTSKFKLKDILLGTGVAILVLNGLAVLAGGLVSTVVPTWLIRLIAGAAFLFFAATTLKGDDDEEENVKDRKIKFAPLSVFCTFFVAELGDKTQLTAITFGANEGLSAAVVVWLACSLGLFAADVIGLLIGYLLKSKAPEGMLNTVAFFIFSIFGILTLRQGFGLLLGAESAMILPLTVVVTVAFVIVCLVLYKQSKKSKA